MIVKTNYKGVHKYRHIIYKIPPNLPFTKGGNIPLFSKEGIGEIFRSMWFLLMNSLRSLITEKEVKKKVFNRGDIY